MKVKKVFNNNVALIESDTKSEMIVMGKGLVFQKKAGDEIDSSLIDKTFVLDANGFSDKLAHLINEIPSEHFDLSNEIITYAKSKLTNEINDNIYITLTDHISFAITRFEQGLVLKNSLLWEVKKFYRKEFDVALHALEIIEKATGFMLPEDEASSIALHLINAGQNQYDMEDTMNMTKMVNDVLNIVKYHYGIQLDENSLNYSRFITHLRYFAYRLTQNEVSSDEENDLYIQVKTKYPESYQCTQKVKAYIGATYPRDPSNDEMLYLMLHIHRVTSREKQNK